MNLTVNSDHIIEGFITDFAESKLTTAELQSFSELKEMNPEIKKMAHAGMRVHTLLKRSIKITASPGFEQRMSARFAMELQEEEARLNRSNIEKKGKATAE